MEAEMDGVDFFDFFNQQCLAPAGLF